MATSAGKVAFTLKGTYNAETTYSILDVVSYGGGSYAAKGTTVGNLPTDTTYWQRLASAGEGGGGAKYGTSQTSGATAEKVVATVYTDFELETGASVLVYFANADTVGSVTLNVDGTGAKSVKMNGSLLPSDFLANNTIYQFIYNGTDYILVSGAEQTAGRTPYDNSTSGLTADEVQSAIDELNGNIASNATSISTLGTEKANNSALANVELTNTATTAHAVGTYFILGGQFVRTTVAIEVGDTITIGTNVEATDVGSVLTELNSNFSTYSKYMNIDFSTDYGIANLNCRKIGTTVYMSFFISISASLSSGTAIFTIPSDYYPATTEDCMLSYLKSPDYNSNLFSQGVKVYSNGQVRQSITGTISSGNRLTALFIYKSA